MLEDVMNLRKKAQEAKKKKIEVKYIQAINPYGEIVLITEKELKKCNELGLTMRRLEV